MGFIGVQPASVPLTASDITNDIINADKIADNSISEEHLDPTVITGLSALGAEPADTDEFLISDAGTLKRMDYSYIKGGGGFVYVGGASLVSTNTSQLNVDSVFSSTYRNYRIFIEATQNSNTGDIRMKLRDASGDITVSNEFYTVLFGGAQNGNVQAGTQTQDNYFRLFENTPDQGNTDYPACVCEITIYCPYVSTDHTHMTFIGSYKHSGGEERARYGSLLMKGQKTVTGLALVSSSGLMNDAQVKVYGMVDS